MGAKVKGKPRHARSSIATWVAMGGAAALLCTAALAYFASSGAKLKPPPRSAASASRAAAPIHGVRARKIDGSELDLASIVGKAALIVNVASS
mmetsp:Transcript_14167/g.43408  ORF Transcript_14167/g.43408 Transcript_14167/m.43408 type:complete len:93 (-) Transcript_14167:747-1025(-)|eukprot:scaffold104390_cov31-Tisochrysis_lutea.AAC.1